jgi:VIT1/CCC1 family predicted Fe2+/Mn2+ transporter
MSARMSARRRPRPAPDNSFLGGLLDPIDRLSETIYSVLVMLTFTLAFRIFRLGGDPTQPIAAEYVNDLLLAAIGATLAWGLIDGVMHILMEVFQRGERHRLLRQIQAAETEQEAVAVIAEELDYVLEPISGESERQTLYRNVLAQLRHGVPRPVGLTRWDFAGALGCVLVAIIAVLPSLVPFVLLRHDYALAVRVSNLVSFAVLFRAGYNWGTYTGFSPWRTGLTLVGVGVLMVAIAIPLGG